MNNASNYTEERYISENLEANKGNPRNLARNLRKDLSSRKSSKSSNILEIQADNSWTYK